ncbi:MAG: hypothetical protein JSW61_06080 [Candidatus Thorarchaeota archaeon]|nr:MAG: hypothetical protein JSW61_06080 [Candidatus Thorarchaeota archaeon]
MSFPWPKLNVRRDPLLLLTILLVTVLSPIGIQDSMAQSYTSADLMDVKVAVYSDRGTLEDSTAALNAMFGWMNANVSYVNSTEIKNGILDEYDILAVPGGSTGSYAIYLGVEGMEAIRQFVANGGSYFGICGGSLLGTRGRIGLFNGSYVSENPGYSIGTYLTEMTVNHNSTGPELSDLPANYTTMFWNSAYFDSDDMSEIITVMSYPRNGLPAMIAFKYEYGTVFLSSPHPEYEEGDARDGTDNWDELDDPDSEWDLMLRVSRWLVDESLIVPTTTTTTTISIPTSPTDGGTVDNNTELSIPDPGVTVAVVSVGIVLVVAVIVRRR